MSAPVGAYLTGLGNPGAPPRDRSAWLHESVPWIALLATRHTYEADPGLWRLGEWGRARTIEDFTHHLRAAMAGERQWERHLAYCLRLFAERDYPFRWLTDAFATLSRVLADELPDELTADLRATFDAGPQVLDRLARDAGIDLRRSRART